MLQQFITVVVVGWSTVVSAQIVGTWASPADAGFSLEILENSDMVCGQVTTISGEKVDESWLLGTIKNGVSTVVFASGFANPGAIGTARIEQHADHLEWHVERNIEESWILGEVSVRRGQWGRGREAILESWCKQHWKSIKEGNSSRVNLLP